MQFKKLVAKGRQDALYRRLDELCAYAPANSRPEDRVFWFIQLVRWLRGRRNEKKGLRLRYLSAQLSQHPEWRDAMSVAMTDLVRGWDSEQLLAYGGIARDFHLAGAVREWFSFRGLPVACSTSDAASILALAFDEDDLDWLSAPELGALALSLISEATHAELRGALDEALVALGNQIAAQAHSPSVRNLSRIDRSPFRGLNRAILEFLEQARDQRRPDGLLGRIRQCLLLLEEHKRELVERGADLNTTFQLDRIAHQLKRLELLVGMSCNATPEQIGYACIAIIRSVTRNTSGRRLIGRSSDLLLQNLVDTAASVGRDYLDERRSSWRAAFSAGAGGGALMAGATLVKFGVASLGLSPFYTGILSASNYVAVFCAAYLLHFTIATKLPAHTAATLAMSVQQPTGHRARLSEFLRVWSAMVRLQFAGLLGNVAVAAPLAYLLDVVTVALTGHHLLGDDKASHVLDSHSLLGPSLGYAALTGVFLWLSSLVGAVADNWVRVTRLVDRLGTNVAVMRTVGPVRARPSAEWVAARVGGLMGNASLGLMLGLVPAAFAIAQLPVEIRHVTVSASSFALAWATGAGTPAQLALAGVGVVAIGATNICVSFAMALRVALSSSARHAHGSARALVKIAVMRWLRRVPRIPNEVDSGAPPAPAGEPVV